MAVVWNRRPSIVALLAGVFINSSNPTEKHLNRLPWSLCGSEGDELQNVVSVLLERLQPLDSDEKCIDIVVRQGVGIEAMLGM